MNHTRFLSIFVPLVLLPSLLALVFPEGFSLPYIKSLEVLVLLAGTFIAWMISRSYSKDLHKVFIFLALFLLIYAVAIIILNFLWSVLDFRPIIVVLILQVLTYSALILACVYIIKVVDVRKLNLTGWLIVSITLLVTVFVALYPPLSQPATGVFYLFIFNIVIRLVDAALITALVPVIWLYVQYLKTHQQQSLTFTVIVIGIVVGTIFDYVLQSFVTAYPNLMATDSRLYILLKEIIYAYGFSIITVGLFAHLKHDEWGFKMIEKALA